MKENLIQQKTYDFSVSIYALYKFLRDKKQYILGDQILRSSTSIAANIEEGLAAASRADFINKMRISLKEARETRYWLRYIKSVGFNYQPTDHFTKEIESIINILYSIIRTTTNQK